MTAHAILLERNFALASDHSGSRPPIEPTLRAVMLACADHRADPAHILGLEPNEVVVIRNPGGRVTESFMQSLVVLATVAMLEGIDPGFELIVMHHTDCGLTRLSAETHADILAPMFGCQPAELAGRHLDDPNQAVRSDIAMLRSHPLMPRTLVVSGLVCDIDSGMVATVVDPRPLGAN